MIRLTLAFPLLLAGCITMADTTTTPATAPTGEFALVTLDGEPFAATATLSFHSGDSVGGAGPCNRWSARLLAAWPAFGISPVIRNQRACPDLRAENDFLLALSLMTGASLEGETLTLSSDDGITMVFRAAP